MASIQDWFDFVSNLPQLAPLIEICIETVDIPINIPIPIPQFIVLPELELPDLSQLLDGLPPPPTIPPLGVPQRIRLKVPVPSLGGGGSGPPIDLDPASLVSGLFSALGDAIGAALGAASPKIELPSIPKPEFNLDILSLVDFKIGECSDEPSVKPGVSIPGQDSVPLTEVDYTSVLEELIAQEETSADKLSAVTEAKEEINVPRKLLDSTLQERFDKISQVESLEQEGYPTYLQTNKRAGELSKQEGD